MSRRQAALVLVLTVGVGLALRLWHIDHGLPRVFHSDTLQVEQALELVRDGSFVDRAPYPVTHTYVYAAANRLAYVWLRAKGVRAGSSWEAFLHWLEAPAGHQLVARVYGAVLGSLLAIAVYFLARVRLDRGPACLAAALVALAPVHVMTSHLARIHVPCITVLVFAAIPCTRLSCDRSTAGRAAVAGVAAGLAASLLQLGLLLAASTVGLCALLVRPWSRMASVVTAFALTFALTYLGVLSAADVPGVVLTPEVDGRGAGETFLHLPATVLSFAVAERLPLLIRTWIAAEPLRAVVLVVFVTLCLLRRRGRRDLLLFGLYPAVVFLALGTTYTHPRYSMSATPFLVVLVASAATSVPGPKARAALVGLLLLAPLATSVRYDRLLGTLDTRVALDELLDAVAAPDLDVRVDRALLLGGRHPAGVRAFPERGDFRALMAGRARARDLFDAERPDVYVKTADIISPHTLREAGLEKRGYRRLGLLPGGPGQGTYLPEVLHHTIPDVWRATRTGPPIAVWVRNEATAERVTARTSAGLLEIDAR